MADEMSSKNSNNSDIEVIGPEDLEESPPPQDTTEEASGESKEEEAPNATSEGGDNVEAVGEIKEETPAVAATDDDDDPPIEVMGGQEAAAPAVAAAEEPARPLVTADRPAASLQEVEDDDEEDDDDIDETVMERLVGLTEMFPEFVRNGTVKLVSGSWGLTKWSYSMSKSVSWIVFSSAALLFMPVMIETERLQMQDQQRAQKNQILLGAGTATSGAPSIGPPPI